MRNEYIFDYRLKNESPAIGAAYPDYTLPEAQYDRYGLPRGSTPDLGAYVYVQAEEEENEIENWKLIVENWKFILSFFLYRIILDIYTDD